MSLLLALAQKGKSTPANLQFSSGKKLLGGNIPVSLGSISVAIQIEKTSHFDLLA